MRKLALALLLVSATAAAALRAETPATPPTTPPATSGNPNGAANPEGAPVPPRKWEMRDDQRAHLSQCKRLTKQIARYERDASWAQERNNELWELSSRERVYRLAAERQRLCPSKEGPTTEQLLAKAAVVAAKLALVAYSHGAF
jgi:hypothetical protein